ncbi:50S ribosomal protein L2 [Candidatus Uhrbacteria bacterium CG10_big_fil_rev_8_21_14_0_10_48_11]|uniref:Large ribosomal subunit protein uL2 n=1 Tax=Candidatus Uhrbacteria bacterium CG10_big_fil_rev_8_21_14_0_10_48_11 TaxID=1975037 RepID=A0A2M8LF62_9BACT|nr:MAG: 50S ribosomal protein L2 [Candidatus Uhrbacteria bacterium CG10_big_fil_rev_8_21_14_0_10_48_11]
MAIRTHKPTSPGRRKSSVQSFDELTKREPEKSLLLTKKRSGGRNNQGKITVRHRGGGAKRYIRIVDFLRSRYDDKATVTAIEYDPNRNAFLALIEYGDKTKAYIVAPQGLGVGDSIVSSRSLVEISSGNRMPLELIPPGMVVHSVEFRPGDGGKLARGAGVGIELMAIEGSYAQLKLPSGEIRQVRKECAATIGAVGNADYRNIRWGKAGRTRHRGIRPAVRGKVMNPVDHPHGGGEGSNPIGMKHQKTPTGKPALGVRTRNRKRTSQRLILRRRSSGRKSRRS